MQKTLANPKLERYLAELKRIRLEAGLRQQDVADRLGLPQSFVSKYETGERRLDLLELEQICEVCGVSLGDFVSSYQKQR